MKAIAVALRSTPATRSALTRGAVPLLAALLCFISQPLPAANQSKSGQTVSPPRVKSVGSPARQTRTKVASGQEVVITGSYLPQRVSPDGTLPVTPSAVSVLTAKDISRLGSANLAQALRRGIAGSR